MNMFLTNKTRLKIKDIVKRISLDEPVALEERIYVEKFAKHNSTIWTWLKKANSLRRYGKQHFAPTIHLILLLLELISFFHLPDPSVYQNEQLK